MNHSDDEPLADGEFLDPSCLVEVKTDSMTEDEDEDEEDEKGMVVSADEERLCQVGTYAAYLLLKELRSITLFIPN